MKTKTQPLLRSMLPFFTIWTGQAFSLLGTKIVQFALIWWLTDKTGSATVLAMASLVGLVPEIVLGPLAGAYVDRWNRRLVMIVADSLMALASVWLAWMFWTGTVQIWHVYLIMFIRAVGGSFHWPAMQASTTLMVPPEHLTRVAGMNQALFGLLHIFGAPLGALAMTLWPMQGVILIDVITAAIAVGPLLWVHIPQPAKSKEAGATGRSQSIWLDIREGLRYILAWPGLMILTAVAMTFKLVLTPAFSLIPLLVKNHFGGGATELSLLEATAGVGIIAGGLLLSTWGGFKRKIYTVVLGQIGFAIAFLIWGALPGHMFNAALFAALMVGLTIPLIDGPIMAILQGTVAPEIQGRVFTIFGSLISLTSPIGLVIAGPISDRMGVQIWYLVAGIMVGVTTVVFFLFPAARNVESNAGQPVQSVGKTLEPAQG